MSEVDNPYRELEYLIAKRIREASAEDILTPEETARAVMRLFAHVQDDWSRIGISTLGQGPGSNLIWTRDLVATVTGRLAVTAKRVDD